MARTQSSAPTALQWLVVQEEESKVEQSHWAEDAQRYRAGVAPEISETLTRDGRLRTLEGQRGLLLSLLSTLGIGVVLVYAIVLRPAAVRQTAEFAEQERIFTEYRQEQNRARDTYERRVTELMNQVSDKDRLVEALRKELALAKVPPKKELGPRLPIASQKVKVCTCNKADPLCDCW